MESDKDEESRDNTQGDDGRSTHCVFTTSDMNTGMGVNKEERSENMIMIDCDALRASHCVNDTVITQMRDAG
jgi:hypothetical protein